MDKQGSAEMSEAVVPIFAYKTDDVQGPAAFLGTGFFIRDPLVLITAHHVIEGYQYIGFYSEQLDKPVQANRIIEDKINDISILHVPEYHPGYALPLSNEARDLGNCMVATLEYSTTKLKDGTFHINPATRMGNITRPLYGVDYRNLQDTMCFELSFPALKGASGAPVIRMEKGLASEVLGIIVMNYQHELLPSQITSVIDVVNDDVISETICYLLPQAVAVSFPYIRDLTDKLPVEVGVS